MSLLHRARKNIVLKFVAEILIRSLAILFTISAARYLGDRDYGHYSLAYFFAGLITIFSDMGLSTVLIRDVSRDHTLLPRYTGNIFSLKIILSLALLILGPGILFLIGYPKELTLMILLSLIYLLCNYILDFFVAITNSLEKMEYELLIKGLYKSLVVAVPIIFLWLGYGLWGFFFALVGAYVLSCLMSGWIIWKKMTPLGFRYDPGLWKQLLRSALPIGISGLFMTVYARIDMVMLSFFGASPAEIGWYSVPVKVVEMFTLFPFLVMAGLLPIFSTLTATDREALRRTYERALIYLSMVSIPLVLTTVVLSDSWLVFFFGPAFVKSVPALKILIWVVPFTFLNYVLINTLIALDQGKMIAWGSGLAVLFNISVNVLVLPKYGYLGASTTTVITEALLVVVFFGVLQHSFFPLAIKGSCLRLGISGGLMGLFLWGFKAWSIYLIWPLALGCYGAALILFGLLTREDWMLLKRLVDRSPAQVEAER
jgi:O-antigen/teichoic acid export membrane protein